MLNKPQTLAAAPERYTELSSQIGLEEGVDLESITLAYAGATNPYAYENGSSPYMTVKLVDLIQEMLAQVYPDISEAPERVRSYISSILLTADSIRHAIDTEDSQEVLELKSEFDAILVLQSELNRDLLSADPYDNYAQKMASILGSIRGMLIQWLIDNLEKAGMTSIEAEMITTTNFEEA